MSACIIDECPRPSSDRALCKAHLIELIDGIRYIDRTYADLGDYLLPTSGATNTNRSRAIEHGIKLDDRIASARAVIRRELRRIVAIVGDTAPAVAGAGATPSLEVRTQRHCPAADCSGTLNAIIRPASDGRQSALQCTAHHDHRWDSDQWLKLANATDQA